MKNDSAAQLAQAQRIASLFDLPEPVKAYDFPQKGNINRETYLVTAGHPPNRGEYLLQRLNSGVFTRPRAVMTGMIACIQAQREALSAGALDGVEWEVIRLIPTRKGESYLELPGRAGLECWRMMTRIPGTATYRSLREIPSPEERVHVAEQAGRGLALFGRLTAGMKASAVDCPLPGYRDTALYYSQLLSALAGARTLDEAEPYLPSDPFIRDNTAAHFLVRADPSEHRRRREDPELRPFIELALANRELALTLHTALKSGRLRKVVIHGDTKLDNFLFSTASGRVKAIVDLDTIMVHSWLSDWGDMVRSLVNVAGEREKNLERVEVDVGIYRALLRGYRGSAGAMDAAELELMPEAPRIMALELAVRFLADYLRGDTYFEPGPADDKDLNKIRAMVQFRLFQLLSPALAGGA